MQIQYRSKSLTQKLFNRHTHYCRQLQKIVVRPRSCNTTKVSDSLIVTNVGIFSVECESELGYKANPVQSREFNTDSVVGYYLPWAQVGVTRLDVKVAQLRRSTLTNLTQV